MKSQQSLAIYGSYYYLFVHKCYSSHLCPVTKPSSQKELECNLHWACLLFPIIHSLIITYEKDTLSTILPIMRHHFIKEENHKFIRLQVKHRLPLVPHTKLQRIQQLPISWITYNVKSFSTLYYSPLHLLLQLLFIFRAKSTAVPEKPSSPTEEVVLIWALGLRY